MNLSRLVGFFTQTLPREKLICIRMPKIKMPEIKSAIYLSLTLSFNLPSACEEISLQLLAYLRAHLIAGLFRAKCDWRNTNCSGPEISSETRLPPFSPSIQLLHLVFHHFACNTHCRLHRHARRTCRRTEVWVIDPGFQMQWAGKSQTE